VRSFLVPAIATLLGRWFWWPVVVHDRAASRDAVRQSTAPPGPLNHAQLVGAPR
jgi:putative drug exporter of the RND superfamily